MKSQIASLRKEAKAILTDNILSYWINNLVDKQNGGFYGRIDGHEQLHAEAPKGAILQARILWTFSAAYRVMGIPHYLEMAERAKRYLIDCFYDSLYGGVYWSLNAQGEPLDTKKQSYAIGFAIYGLSEYYRATGDGEALEVAIKLFNDLESHCFDEAKNGYCEALDRQWNPLDDMRLSDKDVNEKKTMNTHLHILEPYANLYRVWKDSRLEQQLRNLIKVFVEKITDKQTGHLQLFFNEDWENNHHIISYGHDIEATWLIYEAALELKDTALQELIKPWVMNVAKAATEGYDPGQGMKYEHNLDTGILDGDRHWWVQAESVVGYLNLYQYFNDEEALRKALDVWQFIRNNLIDTEHGEWFWSIRADGSVNRDDDKAGFWKCPYHNGRMCLEIMTRAF